MKRLNGVAMAGLVVALGLGAAGCSSKNYVRNRVAPLVEKTNELDERSAANTRAIRETDERAQSGIVRALGAADEAGQQAQQAGLAAQGALGAANDAVNRADRLDAVVKNLDSYKPAGEAAVNFGFDKAELDPAARERLAALGAKLGSAKSYILEVTGGTDSTGGSEYNYRLSQRRAEAVVQFLSANYGVPARRFYLIGFGKDKEVASNQTAAGRRQNRRVEVRLLVAGGA